MKEKLIDLIVKAFVRHCGPQLIAALRQDLESNLRGAKEDAILAFQSSTRELSAALTKQISKTVVDDATMQVSRTVSESIGEVRAKLIKTELEAKNSIAETTAKAVDEALRKIASYQVSPEPVTTVVLEQVLPKKAPKAKD